MKLEINQEFDFAGTPYKVVDFKDYTNEDGEKTFFVIATKFIKTRQTWSTVPHYLDMEHIDYHNNK